MSEYRDESETLRRRVAELEGEVARAEDEILAGPLGALPATGIVLDLAAHGVGSPWHLAWAVPSLLLGGAALHGAYEATRSALQRHRRSETSRSSATAAYGASRQRTK